jgi:hypothetical protein
MLKMHTTTTGLFSLSQLVINIMTVSLLVDNTVATSSQQVPIVSPSGGPLMSLPAPVMQSNVATTQPTLCITY